MVRCLAIGPGAMGFFLYLGILSKLKQEGRLDDLEEISGASAGGLLAFLFLATKGDLPKVLDYALDVPVKQLMKPNLKNFMKSYGLVSPNKIRKVLSEACTKFIGKPDVTFEELYAWHPIKFHVSAYCVDLMKTDYFSVNSTPKLSVLDAVSATIAIPFLFSTVKIGEWKYIDGGAAESTPSGPFLGRNSDVLAMKIALSRPTPVVDMKSYALSILNSTIKLRAVYEVPTLDIDVTDSDVFDFGASNDGKLRMFMKGHATNFS
jgi:predicted acylesterase/phospholipase RssA